MLETVFSHLNMSFLQAKPSTSNPKSTGKPTTTAPENSVIGHVHNLSPIKQNCSVMLDYVTFTLQTDGDQMKEALLYSPSKKPLLEQSKTSRTPIKLVNHAYTEGNQKIVVNDKTFAQTPQEIEYSFQYSELADDCKEPTSVLDVLNTHKESDTVTVECKVSQLKKANTVGNPGKPLQLVEATSTDTTGSWLCLKNTSQITPGSR